MNDIFDLFSTFIGRRFISVNILLQKRSVQSRTSSDLSNSELRKFAKHTPYGVIWMHIISCIEKNSYERSSSISGQ